MSALAIFRTLLLADGPVNGLIAGRIFPIEIPQQATLPAVCLHLVREEDDRLLSGQAHYPEAPVIVDAVANSFPAAEQLGDMIKAALIDWRSHRDGSVTVVAGHVVTNISLDDLDHFDRGEPGNIWRRRIGFRIRYRAAN